MYSFSLKEFVFAAITRSILMSLKILQHNRHHESPALTPTGRRSQPYSGAKKKPGKSSDYRIQQQTLEAVLMGDKSSVPSLRKIALSLGCHERTLQSRFPELCSEIAKLPKNLSRIESLRQSVEAMIASSAAPLSLSEVTRRLGCCQRTLVKHFPDLCLIIKEQYRKPFEVDESRKALEAVLTSDESPKPTLGEIAARLGYSEPILRRYFPKLCSAIGKLRREPLEADGARQVLEDELASDREPPMPLNEIARHLGVSGSVLYNRFPELSFAISARYKSFRKAKGIERCERTCDEVLEATRRIHARGDYPSHRRVEALLGKPGVLMEKAVWEAWHETLRELGLER